MVMEKEKLFDDGKIAPARNPQGKARAELSIRQGKWGEDVAARHLLDLGWRILERNAHPCQNDTRCELDIIAFSPKENRVVFVEVKTHRRHSDFANRLWSVNERKKRNLLRASASWLIRRKWHGNWRFDVVQVYGDSTSGATPEIDHVANVKLFRPNWRFW